MTLKEQFGLGRIPSKEDRRDYKLASYMPPVLGDLSGSRAWAFNTAPLDQFETPECGGFGGAGFCINEPVETPYNNSDGHRFYRMAKIIDGDNIPGTTVRSVAKVLQNVSRIGAYAFAGSVDEVIYWLLNYGPLIVGTIWTEGMFTPDESNIIHPSGEVVGGHCYVINAKIGNYFRIHNSWGNRWGVNGEALISIEDFRTLFTAYGEALAAVEMPLVEKEGCLAAIMQVLKNLVPA